MATYQANQKWAKKAGLKSIQMWLPDRIVEILDELTDARNVEDAITGKKRKISRANVVTAIVDGDWKIWEESYDAIKADRDKFHDLYLQYFDENSGLISDYNSIVEKLNDASGEITTKETEIRILNEQLDSANEEIAAYENAKSDGLSINELEATIAKLPESVLTRISIKVGHRANELQGKR